MVIVILAVRFQGFDRHVILHVVGHNPARYKGDVINFPAVQPSPRSAGTVGSIRQVLAQIK